jgi:hypothetical protein
MKHFFQLVFLLILVLCLFNCKTTITTKKNDSTAPDVAQNEPDENINKNIEKETVKPYEVPNHSNSKNTFEKKPGWEQNFSDWKKKYGGGYKYKSVKVYLDKNDKKPFSQLEKPSSNLLQSLKNNCGYEKTIIDYSWFLTPQGRFILYGLCIEQIKSNHKGEPAFNVLP